MESLQALRGSLRCSPIWHGDTLGCAPWTSISTARILCCLHLLAEPVAAIRRGSLGGGEFRPAARALAPAGERHRHLHRASKHLTTISGQVLLDEIDI